MKRISPAIAARDHPRICGEHTVRFIGSEVIAGSSPHMRGTQFGMKQKVPYIGIIPAYAGNTCQGARLR